MDRKEFLLTLGGVGLTTLIPASSAAARSAAVTAKAAAPTCLLTPAVAEGPFYMDLNLMRSAIAGDHVGAAIAYRFTVVDENGSPIPNALETTDAHGQVGFTSIYPGRLTHLHVKIHLNASVLVTTNLFYSDADNAAVYASSLYSAKGLNPTTVA